MGATVTVGAKRTMEYVLSCLSQFNRGAEEVELVSVGDCISKAAEVSRILCHDFGTQVEGSGVSQLSRQLPSGEALLTSSAFRLRANGLSAGDGDSPSTLSGGQDEFVSFPVYQLLLDYLLATQGELMVGTDQARRLLRIAPTETGFGCRVGEDLLLVRAEAQETRRRGSDNPEPLAEALYRTGFLLSDRWRDIAGKLGQFDDIVLGLDTNILLTCVVTQQILDAIAFTSHPNDAPNWILLVVPNTVMHELEQAANSRGERGELSATGRMGYRALQEILELDQGKDLRGVSLLIVGETDPVLDARVEIRGLREDMKRAAVAGVKFSPKMSVGDTIIRDQFKSFLRQLGFHKGTFFLTGDKSNSALGQAEGLHSLYFPPAYWRQSLQPGQDLLPPQVKYKEQNLTMCVPLGKLIYELAVQFGSISLSWNGNSVRLGCDSRGDSLEHWIHRELKIPAGDFMKLLALYRQQERRVPLAQAEAAWKRETRMAMSW